LVDSSATRGFATPKRRHADDHQPAISENPCLPTHLNQDVNGSLQVFRLPVLGRIDREVSGGQKAPQRKPQRLQ
jgi:hypothetical protein